MTLLQRAALSPCPATSQEFPPACPPSSVLSTSSTSFWARSPLSSPLSPTLLRLPPKWTPRVLKRQSLHDRGAWLSNRSQASLVTQLSPRKCFHMQFPGGGFGPWTLCSPSLHCLWPLVGIAGPMRPPPCCILSSIPTYSQSFPAFMEENQCSLPFVKERASWLRVPRDYG